MDNVKCIDFQPGQEGRIYVYVDGQEVGYCDNSYEKNRLMDTILLSNEMEVVETDDRSYVKNNKELWS